jgi:hypothetical protein
MMRVMPRHDFGQVQSRLFPKYFFLTSASSFLSLVSFLRLNPVNTARSKEVLYLVNIFKI